MGENLRGIVGVDCSWKMAGQTFEKLRLMGLEPRKLPNVVPANPVNAVFKGFFVTQNSDFNSQKENGHILI